MTSWDQAMEEDPEHTNAEALSKIFPGCGTTLNMYSV